MPGRRHRSDLQDHGRQGLDREGHQSAKGRVKQTSVWYEAEARSIVRITCLRRKLDRDLRQPRCLQSVQGEGYLLAPD